MKDSEPVSETQSVSVEMIFSPHTGVIRATCVQDLLAHGITVHPNAVARAWGPEAADAYQQSLRGKRTSATEANDGNAS